ncbi:MAG: 2,3-bisphosphoglycerate-dependent phosphoglycerate mutase [Patescibacteria group bacterium]|jgi:2,3-bisphosphoglycerate-dependent phosphoglycerate mutase
MYKIVLLRHGESVWNKKGLFTGWTDVDLTARGEREAREAGRRLKRAGFKFDLVFENLLGRCSRTTSLALGEIGIRPKIKKDWRLNERHYGALQGMNKKEMVKQYGEEQVFTWRRVYNSRPPKIKKGSRYDQSDNLAYQGLPVPMTESLQDVEKRVALFWKEEVIPALKKKKNILISASGNSLRALVKFLSKMPPDKVMTLNIPTGLPLVYELDKNFNPQKYRYLATKKELDEAVNKVKNQIKVKK